MSYSSGEALVLTRVRACTGFSSSNTSRCDWKLLSSGASDHYAILRPGKPTFEWSTFTDYIITWATVIEVWQLYVDDTTSYTNLYTHITNLLPILAYPHLGDASIVLDSTVGEWLEPEEMWKEGGGPQWLRWRVEINWQEQASANFAE